MPPVSPLAPKTHADHYSYAVYADPAMAESFDAVRFGGPIGRLCIMSAMADLHPVVWISHRTGERCAGCGHVFQNPRLSPEGLDFYYRDFYQGTGQDPAALAFGAGGATYRARAELLRGQLEPRDWLDVGTGHGHFCLQARESWPNTLVPMRSRCLATCE